MSGALPDGWLVRVSRSKGKVYYYHTRTKQTQWVRPTASDARASEQSHASTADNDTEADATRAARKRQRVEDPSAPGETTTAALVSPDDRKSAATAVTSGETKDAPLSADHDDTNAPAAPAAAAASGSKTRAMIAMSMRVGGSAFAARQSNFGPLASTTGSKPRAVFTPWVHQLEAIERMMHEIQTQDADTKAATHVDRYLLQHSTGAGKTMTIAALTYQLLYAVDASGARFHTVVILIDRVKLDEQVGSTVETFLRRNGIDEVFRAESISHLAKLLDGSAASAPTQRVIVTTIHKMGLLVKDDVLLTRLLHRARHDDGASDYSRIAIITDEAHRSHTTSTRETIQRVVMAGESSNDAHITFVGFTATPNAEALQLFGSRAADGILRPFHCYSIAQATADGRVKDVLEHYTCLRFDVETTIPADVLDALHDARALRSVLDHASDDVAVLKAKAAVMMQDFGDAKRALKTAKCMIVARSRRDVLRYYQLVSVFVANRQLKWHIYAAFSGTLSLDDSPTSASVTEETLNSSQRHLASSDIVIVCDKLDTGYNDPKLSRMYIDRYLRSSAQTVQLTSRLNRLHKDKPHVRILDFANHAAQIRRSFATFWDETRAPSDASAVDVDMELADAVTGHTILCDYFPALWDASSPRLSDMRAFVQDHVLPLERDAFQQVVDALRLCCTALSRLTPAAACDDDVWTPRFAFDYDVVAQLKKAVEAETRASDAAASAINVDDIKSKMAARVRSYDRVFSGALHPPSVLRLRETATVPLTEANALELLARGPLEVFEAFVCARSASGLETLRRAAASDSANEADCNPLARHMARVSMRKGRSE